MKIAAFQGNPFFNGHHSPMGAYFSFTCGHAGTAGGMGVEMGRPGNQDVFIGMKEGGRRERAALRVLPFFSNADKLDPAAAFLPEREGVEAQRFSPYGAGEMRRHYGWGTDRWVTKEFEFSIYTPFGGIPEPGEAREAEIREALLPAVVAELIVDNTEGTGTKTGFLALNFGEAGVRILEGMGAGVAGFGWRHFGVAGLVMDLEAKEGAGAPAVFLRWWPHEGLEEGNAVHLLGTTPGLGFEVPAGKKYALRVALGCYMGHAVTTGVAGRYLYARYYGGIEEVLSAGLERFCELKQRARELDEELAESGLSADQQFLVAHATRSYYGNTQLLDLALTNERAAEPYWVVNEGEYRMMNTLDLGADQVFWELERNPWVVRNLLEGFLKRYSYRDRVKSSEKETMEGGISFCHDQGVCNAFSPAGESAYELGNLSGCFSYMTGEELCNWILIAASYYLKSGDKEWGNRHLGVWVECLKSLQARAAAGMLGADSARTGTGSEITTYDSLDASLGQARESLYLAVKIWASACGMFWLLKDAGLETEPMCRAARDICDKAQEKIVSSGKGRAFLPAIMGRGQPGVDARILSAVEGVLYTRYWSELLGDAGAWDDTFEGQAGRYRGLMSALQSHTVNLLKEGENRFGDGGVKLSSTSDNSWLSKIAIVQHVGRAVFNLDENGNVRGAGGNAGGWEKADGAHVKWLTTGPGAYWCACDQIVKGEARGSKYYPRLVTTALWLKESGRNDEV